MRVISKKRLRDFWSISANADSQGPLEAWFRVVDNKKTAWRSWSDLKAIYSTADSVGNCVVFDIGGNKYRLITRVLYEKQKVYVLKVMTHGEYDKNKWKAECGCYSPPPQKESGRKPVPASRKRSTNRGKKNYGK